MRNQILLVLSIFIAGAIAGALAMSGVSEDREPHRSNVLPTDDVDPGDWSGEIAQLLERLDAEREARIVLASELESLRETVAQLGDEPATSAGETGLSLQALERASRRSRDDNGSMTARVADMGYSMDEFEALRQRARDLGADTRYEMMRRREPFLRMQVDTQQSMLGELGEFDYDRYRYAAGMPNRVEITGLAPGLAGENAGLESGDIFLTFDGSRVFSTEQVLLAMIAGDSATPAVIEVSRNGSPVQVVVPRGRMGARLTGRFQNPYEDPRP